MAMTILNNTAASLSLGELNKNVSTLGKQLKKVANGEKITSAGDGTSEYTISERMRVRLRALQQDAANVQTGTSMLKVAEGAIQEQLEIMKTIKEKVINANNDSNTDLDRMTIQKEIDQGLQEIEDIAQETNYNTKRLLVGDTLSEKVRSWTVKSESELVPGSDLMKMLDLNMIDDTYPALNGVTGPFDLFQHSEIKSVGVAALGFSPVPALGDKPAVAFEGAGDAVFTIDGAFTTVDSLDGAAFYISDSTKPGTYVLRRTPATEPKYGTIASDYTRETSSVKELDISGCLTIGDVMALIDNTFESVTGHGSNYFTCSRTVSGMSYTGSEGDVVINEAAEVPSFSGTVYFTGGAEQYGDDEDVDTDKQVAKPATVKVSGIVADTGVTVNAIGDIYRIRFVAGNDEPSSENGVTTIGADYSGPHSFGYGTFTMEMKNGEMTLTARPGTGGNSYTVKSGIESETLNYASAVRLADYNQPTYDSAYATVDVSGYTDVEDLIEDLKGTAIARRMGTCSDPNGQLPDFEDGYPADTNYYRYYEFVDSASPNAIERLHRFKTRYASYTNVIDLNDLRTDVAAGKSIVQAFVDNFPTSGEDIMAATDDGGNTIGIKFKAAASDKQGNNERLFLAQNTLRSYTLDYGKWFEENQDLAIPDFLNNKGFRVYCATCSNQWFNFHFLTDDVPEDMPRNTNRNGDDIKHVYINVSGVTDATSLVQRIYDQAMPQLTGDDENLNHFIRLAADGDKLLVYDDRRYTDSYLQNVTSSGGHRLYDYQWDATENVGGAKIGDGLWDNVFIEEREVYVKDLVIHHTDKASMNIHVQIPQTTLDHLFGYINGSKDVSEFNVLTADSREELLGNQAGRKSPDGRRMVKKDEPGLLDKAIQYLTDANTLVGAQTSRLEMTHDNIITQQESTTASESTIRDADMAKEMTEYTKANVLTQAAQSMLAQANQNSSSVLSLLQ